MTTRNDSDCKCSDHESMERVRYFTRQLMTAEDMRTEQEYFLEKLRRHNRYIHGWGVVCGLSVRPGQAEDPPWQVTICPGYIITPNGYEIQVCEQDFDLAKDWFKIDSPCKCPESGITTGIEDSKIYLAVCYRECDTRPVRVHPAGCGCDETVCEYSRIRESYEVVVLRDLPESHKSIKIDDPKWKEFYDKYKKWIMNSDNKQPELPNCPKTYENDCVVIATITIPSAKNIRISANDISYNNRRVLYSMHIAQGMLMT